MILRCLACLSAWKLVSFTDNGHCKKMWRWGMRLETMNSIVCYVVFKMPLRYPSRHV